jgi:hypothetical protein
VCLVPVPVMVLAALWIKKTDVFLKWESNLQRGYHKKDSLFFFHRC